MFVLEPRGHEEFAVLDRPDEGADLVRLELRKRAPDIELDVVCTLAEALARLENFKHSDVVYPAHQSGESSVINGGSRPPYDLVLTDFNLPDGTGTDLLAHIRGQQLPLPVVVITGFTDQGMLLGLLRAGADDYVIKRDNFAETLALVLRSAFDKFRNETYRRAHHRSVLRP